MIQIYLFLECASHFFLFANVICLFLGREYLHMLKVIPESLREKKEVS